MTKLIITMIAISMFAAPCLAALKTVGKGESLNFDPAVIPASMKANFDVMKVKCIKCHTMERTVLAVTTGIAPITSQPFDRSASKAYGIKMLRKPDSNMNKQEVKAVVDLMNYLIDEAAK